jgi:telomere length regulation protein
MPSQPSFFRSTLPAIRSRLRDKSTGAVYSAFWTESLVSIPSLFTLQTILTSLFGHLSISAAPLECSPRTRGLIKREAELLSGILGHHQERASDLWENAAAVILSREWSQVHARIFACWAALSGTDTEGMSLLMHLSRDSTIHLHVGFKFLLTKTLDLWCSPEHVKHSLLSRHQCEQSWFPRMSCTSPTK